jgi:hypothetical protein
MCAILNWFLPVISELLDCYFRTQTLNLTLLGLSDAAGCGSIMSSSPTRHHLHENYNILNKDLNTTSVDLTELDALPLHHQLDAVTLR